MEKSSYARKFDESCAAWYKDPELNKTHLICQQNYFNHLLRARGHVFLNEIYDALGLPRSSDGQVVGWIKTDDDDETSIVFQTLDDNFIDFNVSGVIYQDIEN